MDPAQMDLPGMTAVAERVITDVSGGLGRFYAFVRVIWGVCVRVCVWWWWWKAGLPLRKTGTGADRAWGLPNHLRSRHSLELPPPSQA